MSDDQSYAILDGRVVPAKDITHEHYYFGMWRSPVDPLVELNAENLRRPPGERWEVFICSCGAHLRYVDAQHVHWRQGCFDLPQYRSAPAVDALLRQALQAMAARGEFKP